MPLRYNVTINPAGKENTFHVTWQHAETNKGNSFESTPEITSEDTLRLWRMKKFQLPIGQKLFRFLDGETHNFQGALDQANQCGEILQLHLNTCEQTRDWPFELLAAGEFLLPGKIHLVRCVSARRKEKKHFPQNRPLKLLFMACSAMDVKPEQNFEREEEAIFKITERLPIEINVEDSGTLEGLGAHLERMSYDVVHLSGLTGVAENGRPYVIMEDETGRQHKVSPSTLWTEALVKNPPPLVFISTCPSGWAGSRPSGADAISFARLLVKSCDIPAVLGWERPVSDEQAALAGNIVYYQLSRGKSVLEAVQRARYELIKKFSSAPRPAWPMLRIFSNGTPLNPIIENEQPRQPKARRMKHVFLKNSRVKVLAEGFVGRRRQIQTGLHALKHNHEKIGVLILGTGGLGKSCLAGKLCERFPYHKLIIIHGKFNAITLKDALKDAFIATQDVTGQQILVKTEPMEEKLPRLCSTSFKEKKYLILLDDFEENLEGMDKGRPGPLQPEAADLLKHLLLHLPSTRKNTQVLITCRYNFALSRQYPGHPIDEHLERIWLTGFRPVEQRKKALSLKGIINYPDQSLASRLLAAGHGNPRLMEWLDTLSLRMNTAQVSLLIEAVEKKQEEFILEHTIRELLNLGGKGFARFLRHFSVFRLPVQLEGVEAIAINSGIRNWKSLLRTGMNLSLIEHDQSRHSFCVTPLLREKLLAEVNGIEACHRVSFNYYGKTCGEIGDILKLAPHEFKKLEGIRESMDPVASEEWIHHAYGCGEHSTAWFQGFLLIFHLIFRAAYYEALRIGLWLQSKQDEKSPGYEEAFILIGIDCAYHALGDNIKSTEYSKRALAALRSLEAHHDIFKLLSLAASGSVSLSDAGYREAEVDYRRLLPITSRTHGEAHLVTAMILNSLGQALYYQGEFKKSIHVFGEALHIVESGFGDVYDSLIVILNNLAGSYEEIGDYKQAIYHYRRALDIARKHCPEMSPSLVTTLNNLGSCYTVAGDYEQAVQYTWEALDIGRLLFGKDSMHIAQTLCNLGTLYYNRADYSKAIELFEQALVIWKENYGNLHPKLTTPLNALGEIWKTRGDIPKAISYHQQALQIKELAYGKDHPGNATSLINLGSCLDLQGKYPGAIDYLEKALDICRKTYGDSHPHIAIIFNNLGEIHRQTGQTEKAFEYLNKSLEMSKVYFGDEHHETAPCFANLGALFRDQGDTSRAGEYYGHALELYRTSYGENHHRVADVLFNLGNLGNTTGNHEDALVYFKEALNISKTIHGEQHAHTGYVLNRLAFTYLTLTDYQQVITFAKLAQNIILPLFGEQNNVAVDNMTLLGLAHRYLGNHSEAIDYLARVLVESLKRYGEEHQEVSAARAHLGMVYLEQGDPGTAKEYLEKAYRVNNKLLGPEHPGTLELKEALTLCMQ